MCGAQISGEMSLAEMVDVLRGFLGPDVNLDSNAPKPDLGFNIRPTQQVRMVSLLNDAMHVTTARWWFVPQHFDGALRDWKATTFNARIETANENPTFSPAWKTGRCVIPAIGYYEWTGEKDTRQPWFIAPKMNAPLFYFAGLYATRPDGIKTCTILTRPALVGIEHLHARGPVMLSSDAVTPWLTQLDETNDVIETLGTSFNNRMTFHKVRPIKTGDQGPDLIEPYSLPEQLGLFA